ncbi:nicotinate-nucleotide--dimethylbenzimidazole phosphoribosyltransferase [Syntrophomonas zehnderi]|nr:nicotinate-nucleotide--dimethylbenzimidazole phosphoribosyltransferase [Syntrophomonas zehnderi]
MELLTKTLSMVKDIDNCSAEQAQQRLNSLIKPQGSLGRLETIAIWLAGIKGNPVPQIGKKVVLIMAADHGVAREGITAFPPQAGNLMIKNFLHQGAAVNVLANYNKTRFVLVDVGLSGEAVSHPDLFVRRIRAGTRNICREEAMTRREAIAALELGIEIINKEIDAGATIVAIGELGIGNTAVSSAILACLSGRDIREITGRGTGLDDCALTRKQQVIAQALEVNRPNLIDPVDILSRVGGLEIGALTGVIVGSAARSIPVVLDGFVSSIAAWLACRMNPQCRSYLLASHLSEEPGHRIVLEELKLEPLLDFGLRIGEGTGAVLVFPLIESAVKIINEMATMDEVGIKLLN